MITIYIITFTLPIDLTKAHSTQQTKEDALSRILNFMKQMPHVWH